MASLPGTLGSANGDSQGSCAARRPAHSLVLDKDVRLLDQLVHRVLRLLGAEVHDNPAAVSTGFPAVATAKQARGSHCSRFATAASSTYERLFRLAWRKYALSAGRSGRGPASFLGAVGGAHERVSSPVGDSIWV